MWNKILYKKNNFTAYSSFSCCTVFVSAQFAFFGLFYRFWKDKSFLFDYQTQQYDWVNTRKMYPLIFISGIRHVLNARLFHQKNGKISFNFWLTSISGVTMKQMQWLWCTAKEWVQDMSEWYSFYEFPCLMKGQKTSSIFKF